MKSFIQDLFGHQEWADAELWKAVESCPGALDQKDISKRFRHFHSTQYAYHLLKRSWRDATHNRLRALDMEGATEGRVVKRR